MTIQYIINQEKQKELIRKSKQKQDEHLKQLFYKDCYKLWKDYKKAESPYFWWLGYFHPKRAFLGYSWFYYWLYLEAPTDYPKTAWFENKWSQSYDGKIKIKHKSNPNDEWVYL